MFRRLLEDTGRFEVRVTEQPIPGSGLDQPTLRTVNYGTGRIFVTALGHDPDAMKGAGFVATLTCGTEWAATGEVSIPRPEEFR